MPMRKYFQAPWKIKEVLWILLISSVLLFLAAITLFFSSFGEVIDKSSNKSFYFLGIFLIQWLIILLPLAIVTLKNHKFKWKNFGFRKVKILKALGLILSGYLMFLGITFIVSIIIVFFNVKIPGYQIQREIIPLFGTGITSLIIAGVMIVIIAPIVEEIFFRGFLLRSLSNKVGLIYGSIISASIFAIFHLQLQNIIPIFILGLIINSIVIKSKSLWPAIGFHIFNNTLVFIIEILLLKDVISLDKLI